MSDASDKKGDPNSLLAAFELGPDWARSDAPEKKYDKYRGDEGDKGRGGRGDQRGRPGGRGDFKGGQGRRDFGGGGGGGRRQGGERGQQRGGHKGQGRRDGQQRDLPQPAPGVRVTLTPAKQAVHLVGKEIQHVARVYSLFDIAQLLLASRERYRLRITSDPKRPPMFRGRKDESLFLTREEAVRHFWQSGPVDEFYDSEESETEPPSGNFQVVARCGMSGEWLGPPNFHAYQSNLRRLHRERFANMPFEVFASRVKTERGEEAVNEWLESMKKRVRWRPKGGDDDSWTFDRAEVERDFSQRFFGEAFEETRDADLSGDVEAMSLSIGILAAVKIAGSHARRHPAMLIPAVCRLLESEHLAVFKKQGKLFAGPARPHPLASDAVLAERPTRIVEWLDANPDAKLGGLWQAVLPEGAEEPPKEWLVDLFWLLTQGHVLLFADDTLVLPKRRKGGQGGGESKKAKPAKPSKPSKLDSPANKTGKTGETGGPTKADKKGRAGKSSPVTPAKGPNDSTGSKAAAIKVPPRAKEVRRIAMMSPGQIMALRGEEGKWARRLMRRERIRSLVEE